VQVAGIAEQRAILLGQGEDGDQVGGGGHWSVSVVVADSPRAAGAPTP
jgi:hypothetical protein